MTALPVTRSQIVARLTENNIPFVEMPLRQQDLNRRGDSICVYNDDGGIGEFGEIECMGQAVGWNGRTSSTDTLALWCYVGRLPDLQLIGRHLLGIEVAL